MGKRSFSRSQSGQVLIVSALLVALLLLSTALYVIEVGKDVPAVDSTGNVDFGSYKPSIRNALVSALANISSGGGSMILSSDLDTLKTVICEHSYRSQLSIDYSLLDSGNYNQGVWVSWGSDGVGVSSIYATFTFNSSGYSGASTAAYSVNVTSAVHVNGSYQQQNESLWHVTLSIETSNEAGPALAQGFTFRVQNGTSWLVMDSPVLVDHGDGSYEASFTVDSALGNPLVASVSCLDTRGIYVMANVTCNRMT
jgi:hypothetical protein